jgi:hypothetical protein
MLFWTLALFFGASIAFRAIQDATESSPILVTIGLEVALLVVLVVTIVLVVRRGDRGRARDGDGDRDRDGD